MRSAIRPAFISPAVRSMIWLEPMPCSQSLKPRRSLPDKAFDADQSVLEPLAEAGKTAVIPSRKTRTIPRAFDKDLYKARHLIENFFAKLKQFRAIATRYDKTARCFLAGIHLAAALIWLN